MKKKKILIYIVCCILFIGLITGVILLKKTKATKLNSNETIDTKADSKSEEQLVKNDVGIEIQIIDITPENESLKYYIKNYSTKEYEYGAEFALEKYKNGKWTLVKTAGEIVWDTEIKKIAPAEEKEEIIDLKKYNKDLSNGKYRIIKYFTSGDDKKTIYGEFEAKGE